MHNGHQGTQQGTRVAELLRLIKSEDKPTVVNALRELRELMPTSDAVLQQRVVEALVPLLQDNYTSVKQHAVWALGELGLVHDAGLRGRAIGELIPCLTDSDDNVRINATWSLDTLGEIPEPLLHERAIATLIQCLTDRVGAVRRNAAWALGKLVPSTDTELQPRAVGALIPLLGDSYDKTRQNAVRALGELGLIHDTDLRGRAIEGLLPCLTDSDSNVRIQATRALDKLGLTPNDNVYKSTIEGLIQRLKDRVGAVKENAAFNLGKLVPSTDTEWQARVVEALIPLLGDGCGKARRNTARALGKLGLIHDTGLRGRAIEGLIQCLTDSDGNVRIQATWSLDKLGLTPDDNVYKSAIEGLIQCLTDRVGAVKENAAWDLGKLVPSTDTDLQPRVVGALIPLLGDPYTPVKQNAVRALGKLGLIHDTGLRGRAIERLIASLTDSDDDVRIKATWSLDKLGLISADNVYTSAIDALIQCLTDRVGAVRRNAALALGKLAPSSDVDLQPRIIEALIPLLEDNYTPVKHNAAWGLVKVKAPLDFALQEEIVNILTPSLKNNNREERKEAAWALGEMELTSAPGLQQRIIEELTACLEDIDEEVRALAAEALAKLSLSYVGDPGTTGTVVLDPGTEETKGDDHPDTPTTQGLPSPRGEEEVTETPYQRAQELKAEIALLCMELMEPKAEELRAELIGLLEIKLPELRQLILQIEDRTERATLSLEFMQLDNILKLQKALQIAEPALPAPGVATTATPVTGTAAITPAQPVTPEGQNGAAQPTLSQEEVVLRVLASVDPVLLDKAKLRRKEDLLLPEQRAYYNGFVDAFTDIYNAARIVQTELVAQSINTKKVKIANFLNGVAATLPLAAKVPFFALTAVIKACEEHEREAMLRSVVDLGKGPEGRREDVDLLARHIGMVITLKPADNDNDIESDRHSIISNLSVPEDLDALSFNRLVDIVTKKVMEGIAKFSLSRRPAMQVHDPLAPCREQGEKTARAIIMGVHMAQCDGLDHDTKVSRLALMGFGMLAIAKEIFNQADKDFSQDGTVCKVEDKCTRSKYARDEKRDLTNLVIDRCMGRPDVIIGQLSKQAGKEQLVREMAEVIKQSFELYHVVAMLGVEAAARVRINLPQIEHAIDWQISTYAVANAPIAGRNP